MGMRKWREKLQIVGIREKKKTCTDRDTSRTGVKGNSLFIGVAETQPMDVGLCWLPAVVVCLNLTKQTDPSTGLAEPGGS